jgi:hypothetical protein
VAPRYREEGGDAFLDHAVQRRLLGVARLVAARLRISRATSVRDAQCSPPDTTEHRGTPRKRITNELVRGDSIPAAVDRRHRLPRDPWRKSFVHQSIGG